MNKRDILTEALYRAINKEVRNGAYGLLIEGIYNFNIKSLLTVLGGSGSVCISFIGATDELEELKAWAAERGWDESNFGFGATHAVAVRNEAPTDSIKLAVVWEEEERIHSLTRRGYHYVGPKEVQRQVCYLGQEQAPNEPQKNLWSSMLSKGIFGYLSLEGILDYYSVLFSEGGNTGDGPRKSLPLLGLLPDKELLTGNVSSVEQITSRLLKNVAIVERIQLAEEEDRKIALNTIKLNEGNQSRKLLRKAYGSYLSITSGEATSNWDLELSAALALLSGRVIPDKPSGEAEVADTDHDQEEKASLTNNTDTDNNTSNSSEGSDTRGEEISIRVDDDDEYTPIDTDIPVRKSKALKQYKSFSEAAVCLANKENRQLLTELVKKALELLKGMEYREQMLECSNSSVSVQVKFKPSETAISMSKHFIGKDKMGGALALAELPLDTILTDFGRFTDKLKHYDDVRFRKLVDFFENKVERVAPGCKGSEALRLYAEIRNEMLAYAEFLAIEPLACLVAVPELRDAASRYLSVYIDMMKLLENHYSVIRKKSPKGAFYIYKEILELDVIQLRSATGEAVMLSPLSPLVLWKYLEIANLLSNEDRELVAEDIELLSEDVIGLPEPLLAIHLPGEQINESFELGYSQRIGALPLYQSTSKELSDLSQNSIGNAAVKLASLYPAVRRNLRLLVVDPVTTKHISSTIQALVAKYQFEKVTLILFRTRGIDSTRELPFDSNLRQLVYEGKCDIEVIVEKDADHLYRYIKQKPVHILGISESRNKSVELIESEETKLHPLSVPHKIQVDELMGTVALIPRSTRNDSTEISNPFETYHRFIAQISGNYHTELSVQESGAASIQHVDKLIQYAQFVIAFGNVQEITSQEKLLRLSPSMTASGDIVYTYYSKPVMDGFIKQLKKLNYNPDAQELSKLIKRLQGVGGEGLFSIINNKGGFSDNRVKGLLGLAIALNWYYNHSTEGRGVIVSLDSHLAYKWLGRRRDKKRSDFLGIRQLSDGSYTVDIIEVKAYQATNDTNLMDSHPAQQLQAVQAIIDNIISNQGDLLTDRRRELLRLQLFREALQFNVEQDSDWISSLNSIIDGEENVKVNLTLLEIAFDQNIASEDRPVTNEAPIRVVRLGEKEIQSYLSGYGEYAPQSLQGEDLEIYGDENAEEENTPSEEFANEGLAAEASEVYIPDNTASIVTEANPSSATELDQIASNVTSNSSLKDEKPLQQQINSEARLLVGKRIGSDREVFWDHRRSISNQLANHNIIITGDPGKGKTQSIKGLIRELRKNQLPVLAFDFKDDYVDREFLEAEGMNKFDVMLNGLPFNPLVPHADPNEGYFVAVSHIIQIEGILTRIYKLGVQQATQLRKAIIEAFKRKGIETTAPTNPTSVERYPTFKDVYNILKEEERENGTLLGRLDLLFQLNLFPDYPRITFEELMTGSYTIRLSQLPGDEIKATVAEMMILAIHGYLLAGSQPRRLTRAVVLDEAHRVSRSAALLGLMREGRAFGIGMLIATQFPTDILQDIYGCTDTKLFLGNDNFLHAEAAAKQLEGGASRSELNQLAEQIRSLKQFQAVLRNSQYPKAFVEVVPYYQR